MNQIEIPGYRIEKKIGIGGMATVYLAEQLSLGRPVALKVMAPALAADPTFGERFLKEARTVARLSHPNILSIYDIGASGHFHYMAVEYLGGDDLNARIQLSLTPGQSLDVLKQLTAALGYAHGEGFVHRDIKPENILFRKDGTVVLTDFGIAKTLSSGTRMTKTGMSIGTPHYMSPEQARGQQVDGRSDLYSLGVVFYEMLTGKVPYEAEDTIAVAYAHVNDPVPELPTELSAYQPLIDRLMAKNPSDRFADAASLLQAIEQLQAGQRLARPASATRVIGDRSLVNGVSSKRSGLMWGLGGALAAVAIAGGIYFFRQLTVMIFPKNSRVISSHTLPVSQSASPYSTTTKLVPEYAALNRNQQMQKRITELLSAADSDVKALRLSSPKGNNASEKYKEILSLDPNNRDAMIGIENIANKYIELCKKEIKNQRIKKAQDYLQRVQLVSPNDARISSIKIQIEPLMKKVVEFDHLMDMGNKAFVDNEPYLAQDYYNQALKLYPDNKNTIENIEKTNNIEKFRDKLKNGKQGPLLKRFFVFKNPGDIKHGEDMNNKVDKISYISEIEMTWNDFNMFVESNGINKTMNYNSNRINDPVSNISYKDALAYIKWLSIQTGKNYRLPSKKEIESALSTNKLCGYEIIKGLKNPIPEWTFEKNEVTGVTICKVFQTITEGSFSGTFFLNKALEGEVGFRVVRDCVMPK